MSDLEKMLNSEAIFAHPLLRIAIGHYQFQTIHPFLDGNGRLGRLMISLYLASKGLLKKPALYLSDYFERHKTACVDHLMAVREGHHLRGWLIFFLHGVEETARNSAAVFCAILEISQPITSVKRTTQIIGGTPNTASALINDLVGQGVLVEMTGRQRDRLFAFHDYIALFRQ